MLTGPLRYDVVDEVIAMNLPQHKAAALVLAREDEVLACLSGVAVLRGALLAR